MKTDEWNGEMSKVLTSMPCFATIEEAVRLWESKRTPHLLREAQETLCRQRIPYAALREFERQHAAVEAHVKEYKLTRCLLPAVPVVPMRYHSIFAQIEDMEETPRVGKYTCASPHLLNSNFGHEFEREPHFLTGIDLVDRKQHERGNRAGITLEDAFAIIRSSPAVRELLEEPNVLLFVDGTSFYRDSATTAQDVVIDYRTIRPTTKEDSGGKSRVYMVTYHSRFRHDPEAAPAQP